MKILETERLTLRELNTGDADFILELVNEPSWLRFIGDKGIKTVEAARDYLLKGPMEMYRRLGFGLWLVELREGGVPIGICGLIKREALEDVDVGFAFLPAYWRKGYAFEAATATMRYGKGAFGLEKIVAITSPENVGSAQLLEKMGFSFERMVRLSESAPEAKLFGTPV